MKSYLILNAKVVNEGVTEEKDILIKDGFIQKIEGNLQHMKADEVIDASGLFAIPGAIDDQVHFREPGLTHKAEIYTEAKAAVAGGVTTFMEMPNTVPQAVTIEELEKKYARAAEVSLGNYSFFMGATNDNLEELKKVDRNNVCGVKIFMGSSTGNMLVDNQATLEGIFGNVDMLIATHCEDDVMIKENTQEYIAKYGDNIPMEMHPIIRSEEACYNSSSQAVALAKKTGAKLHILHISTAKELELFSNALPLEQKKITCEACIHHLWFEESSYKTKGSLIKWNPAVKKSTDRDAIFKAVLGDVIDVIATDHAPHTYEEKQNPYTKAPSGGPLVQHSVQAMMDFYLDKKISIEKVVEKLSHHPAILFQIDKRGFLREGYWADIVLVDPNKSEKVAKGNIHYKCGWSPFEGHTFKSSIVKTFVSGFLAYSDKKFDERIKGKRLKFNR